MLHYYGSRLALDLGEAARYLIPLYLPLSKDKAKVFVAFHDLEQARKRYVKFEKVDGVEWIFMDVCDNNI